MMQDLPSSIMISLAVMALFLSFAVGLTYVIRNNFARTRLVMTAFFLFIVFTLTLSFWDVAAATYPFAAPSFVVGLIIGYIVGVRAAEEKLKMQGLKYYMEHFAHVHVHDVRSLNWWSLINFYSIMGGLLLINLVGLSNVIFRGAEFWAIVTSVFGAFLIGTIVPYLAHLWGIRSHR